MSVTVNQLDIKLETNAKSVQKEFTKLSASINNVKRSLGGLSTQLGKFDDVASENMQDVSNDFEQIKESTDKLGISTKKIKKVFSSTWKGVTKMFSGVSKIFRSFTRVAFYRIIRTILSTITNGFREGTENAYLFARAMGLNVAQQLDKVSTSMLYLKNQIGAVGLQLLASLQPVIDKIVDSISVATTYLSKLFAVLNGGHEYVLATRNAKAFAKAQRDILGFDEINKLSGDTTNNLYSFTTQSLSDSEFSKFENRLKTIKDYAQGIGIALAGWKLSSAVASFFSGMQSSDELAKAIRNKILLGGAIVTVGLTVSYALGEYFVGKGKMTEDDLKEMLKASWGSGILASIMAITMFGATGTLATVVFSLTAVLTMALAPAIVRTREKQAEFKQAIADAYNKTGNSQFMTARNNGGLLNMGEMQLELSLRATENTIKNATNVGKQVYTAIESGLTVQGSSLSVSSRLQNVKNKSVTTRATGGFVNSGQLFLARENGAEMVGSIGGRTAVANNDQIVEAIKQGVYEAMSRANGNVNVTLQGDAKGLFKVIQQQAKQYAYATGNNAF